MADETKDPLRARAMARIRTAAVERVACEVTAEECAALSAPAPEPQGLLTLDEIADKAEAYAKELGSVDALRFALENLAALVRQHASRALRASVSGAPDDDLHAVLREIQRYQPSGSPPPGGAAVLAAWVLRSLYEGVRPAYPPPGPSAKVLLRCSVCHCGWEEGTYDPDCECRCHTDPGYKPTERVPWPPPPSAPGVSAGGEAGEDTTIHVCGGHTGAANAS